MDSPLIINKVTANIMAENEVNRIIQARFGDDKGLKIADIIENKPIQGMHVTNEYRQACSIYANNEQPTARYLSTALV